MTRRRSATNSVSFFAFQDIITSVVGIFVLVVLSMILELVDKTQEQPEFQASIPAETLEKLESQAAERQQEYERLRQFASGSITTNKWNKDNRRRDLLQAAQTADAEVTHLADMISEVIAATAVARQSQTELEKQYVAAAAARQEAKDLGDQADQLEMQIAELKSDEVLIFRDTSPDGKQMVLVDVSASGFAIADSLSGNREAFSGASRLDNFEAWLRKKQLGARRFLVFVRPDAISDSTKVRECLESAGASYGFDVLPASKQVRFLSQVDKK